MVGAGAWRIYILHHFDAHSEGAEQVGLLQAKIVQCRIRLAYERWGTTRVNEERRRRIRHVHLVHRVHEAFYFGTETLHVSFLPNDGVPLRIMGESSGREGQSRI